MKYITARRLNLFFTGLKNGVIKTKEESMACTDPKRLVGNGVVKELNGSLIASGSRTLLATSTTNGAWITTNLTNDKVSNYKHLCLEVLANENRSVIGNIPVSMIFYGREQHLYDLEFYSSGAYIRGYIKILLDTSISIYAGLSSYSLVNAKLYGIK